MAPSAPVPLHLLVVDDHAVVRVGMVQLRRSPLLPVAVLSADTDPDMAARALREGAAGWLPKAADPRVLISALELVLQGGSGGHFFDGGLELGPDAASVTLAGSARLGGNNVLRMDLAAGDADHPVLGTFVFGGTLKPATAAGFDAVAGARYDLFDWGFQALGSFGSLDMSQALLPDGLRWDTRDLYSDGVLQITAVPEPATWILSAAGLALVVAASRRRKR